MEFLLAKYNYWFYILIMMVGFYAMISKNNLVKKMIGVSIFQAAIILFYVSIGAKRGATIPIIEHGHDAVHHIDSQYPRCCTGIDLKDLCKIRDN